MKKGSICPCDTYIFLFADLVYKKLVFEKMENYGLLGSIRSQSRSREINRKPIQGNQPVTLR